VTPLRHAAATDEYTLRGGAVEEWEPRFTLHGFRYVEIEGWPGDLTPDDVVAVVCHTDMPRTGWFSCSEPLLDQLHDNIVWSMRGNFVDVPPPGAAARLSELAVPGDHGRHDDLGAVGQHASGRHCQPG